MELDRMRAEILQAVLPHVAFDGWTETALLAGGRDLGLSPAQVLNAFPGGPAEAVEAFSDWADEEMLRRLGDLPLEEMRVRDRIAAGVRARLEALEPHREAVRRGLSFLALPPNLNLGRRLLWRTADALWYAAGDRATDYNYYSKRLLLSGVFSTTLLHWLDDRSEGHADSWAFLERRIDEVLKVGGRLGKVMGRFLELPERLLRRRDAGALARRARSLGVR